MLDALLPYYERELSFLRTHAGEFAARHPKVARRLLLDREQCEDPHVERLLEAFAFLASRIHFRLDEDYGEISEAYLQVLYPHYTRPVPSASILQFRLEEAKPEITARYVLPRHQRVLSPPIQGLRCQFRTCYEVELWPLRITRAALDLAVVSEHLRRTSDAQAALTLELETLGGLPMNSLPISHLRFFLDGEPGLVSLLYELIFTEGVEVRVGDGSGDPAREVRLPRTALRAMGFEPEEALLDQDPRSLPGYRLFTEFFAFPDKFHFLEIGGLDHPRIAELPGSKRVIQIHLGKYGDSERHTRLARQLTTQYFKLGCTPIVNLFPHAAEPIRVTHERTHYAVQPDHRRPEGYEVSSIDGVVHTQGTSDPGTPVHPFYALGHPLDETPPRFYWYASREPSSRPGDRGTQMQLSLVDLDFRHVRADSEVLSLSLTCTNRDLPEQLPFGGGADSGAEDCSLPGHSVVKRCTLLRKCTPSLRPPDKRGFRWRLISHLTSQQTSLVAHGKEPLQEMLQLYNLTDSILATRQIQGIHALEARPGTARLPGPSFSTFVRGLDVHATFDETYYTGANLLLFASVIERFLAHSCPPNSFIRFHLHTRQREGKVASWPPRVADTPLI